MKKRVVCAALVAIGLTGGGLGVGATTAYANEGTCGDEVITDTPADDRISVEGRTHMKRGCSHQGEPNPPEDPEGDATP